MRIVPVVVASALLCAPALAAPVDDAHSSELPVVVGQVVDAWGNPYGGASIEVDGREIATADRVGSFRFSVSRPGSFVLRASHEDALPDMTSGARVHCERGEVARVELYVPRAARLGGRVVVEKSHPIKPGTGLRGAVVFVQYEAIGSDGLELRLARTGSTTNGEFMVHGLQAAGRARVWAELTGWTSGLDTPVLVTDAGWENVQLRLQRWPGFSERRAPIGGSRAARVEPATCEASDDEPVSAEWVRTILRLPRAEPWPEPSTVDVVGLVTPLDESTVDLPVVTLRAVDAGVADEATLTTLTRRDGSFAFVGLPRGCYALRARSFTHASPLVEVDLTTDAAPPVLPMQRVFRVIVKGLSLGEGIERAALVQPDGTLLAVRTLAGIDGRSILVDVPAGTHRVRFDILFEPTSWHRFDPSNSTPPSVARRTAECVVEVREGGANTVLLERAK